MNLSNELEKLRKMLPLTEELVEPFETELDSIRRLADPECIGPLLRLLDDDEVDFFDIQQSILVTAERFPRLEYYPRLIAAMPELRKNAPGWAYTAIISILNSGDGILLMEEAKKASIIEKRALADVLCEIGRKFEKYSTTIPKYLQLLGFVM